MHTEHLQNVGVGRVVGGWLVAAAVTSLVVFVFIASGAGTGEGVGNAVATTISVAAGFAAGGFFTGFRAMRAPILHGAGIGITSVVAWALANVVVLFEPDAVYRGVTPAVVAALMLVQLVAAVIGALLGYNVALRGKPGLREDLDGS
ncbi:MAG: hypothetical protein ACREL7_16115 [Longimicrobiales bacterium]